MTIAASAQSLRDDQRGAVMLTGLFMSCFLIGALWFVIGIGDTLVFREQMQEAADHGAFTAASMNAKGMNFIALLNLVMVAATAIYLVLGLITDIAGAIHAVCIYSAIFGNYKCAFDCLTSDCPTWVAWNGAFKIWDGYYKTMKQSFGVLHKLQQGAAYVYPLTGAAEAYQVGKSYEGDRRHGSVNVLALSASMLPLGAVRAAGNAIGGKAKAIGDSFAKEGMLPVEPRKNEKLCKKVVTVATNAGIDMLGMGSSVSGMKLSGSPMKILNNILGAELAWRYCNAAPPPNVSYRPLKPLPPLGYPITGSGGGWDADFWKKEGFFVVYGATSNGDIFMQTWAMTLGAELRDDSDSKVKLAGTKPSAATKYLKTEQPGAYFAQAEMYFDCKGAWQETACNFEDNALFAIKWRARLRRLQAPQVVTGLVEGGLWALNSSAANVALRQAFGGKAAALLAGLLGKSGLTQRALDNGAQALFSQVQMIIAGKVGQAAGAFDPKIQGVYH